MSIHIEALDGYKPPIQTLSEKYIQVMNNLGKRHGANQVKEWLRELKPTNVISDSKSFPKEEHNVLERAFSSVTRKYAIDIPFSDLGTASIMEGLRFDVEENRIQIQDKPQI